MAQRVKQAAVQDGADTDALIPGSFPQHHHHHHSTNSIHSHDSRDSSSSLLLADDEDSLAGSLDEADGEFC
jgi:hypothetical protein